MSFEISAQTSDFARMVSEWAAGSLVDWRLIADAGVAAGCIDTSILQGEMTELRTADAAGLPDVAKDEFLSWLAQIHHWHADTELLTVARYLFADSSGSALLLDEAWGTLAEGGDVPWVEDGLPKYLHVWEHLREKAPDWLKSAAEGLPANLWTDRRRQLVDLSKIAKALLGVAAVEEATGLLERLVYLDTDSSEGPHDVAGGQLAREFAELRSEIERARESNESSSLQYLRHSLAIRLPASVDDYARAPTREVRALRELLGLPQTAFGKSAADAEGVSWLDDLFTDSQLSELDALIERGAIEPRRRTQLIGAAVRKLTNSQSSAIAARMINFRNPNDWLSLARLTAAPQPRLPLYLAVDSSASMGPYSVSALTAVSSMVENLGRDPILGRQIELSLVSFASTIDVDIESTALRDVHFVPYHVPEGPKLFGPALDHLGRKAAFDIELARTSGNLGSRPLIILISGGSPTDRGWRDGLRSLAAKTTLIVVSFGTDDDWQSLLRDEVEGGIVQYFKAGQSQSDLSSQLIFAITRSTER